MTAQPPIVITCGDVTATVLPDEGGVLVGAHVQGRPVLAATPWASAVVPSAHPAASEDEWVSRWRGGWQLCFPTAGHPDPASPLPQGFHGAASQAPWVEAARATESVTLDWADEHGLWAHRVWRATPHGIAVATRVGNRGGTERVLVIAEHLILGGDILAEPLTVDVPAATELRPLDYAGLPTGAPRAWPGEPSDQWMLIDRTTPARVVGLEGVEPRRVAVRGAHAEAVVSWQGSALPHALLWEELGVSTEHPWNGQVVALGIEPTSTPHGAGTALDDSLVRLAPGGELTWSVSLTVRWASGARPSTTTSPTEES